MPPYLEMHREHLILLFGYGGLAFFGLTLALSSAKLAVSFRKKKDQEHLEKFPDGLTEAHRPVPLFLIMLYACLAVWAVVYILAHGLGWLEFAG